MCGKLPTPWGSNCSSSNIIDWQFSRLCGFLTNGISLCSGEAEMKNLQTSRQAHFLGTSSPDSQTRWIALLFVARSRTWLKGESAHRLSAPQNLNFRKFSNGFQRFPKILEDFRTSPKISRQLLKIKEGVQRFQRRLQNRANDFQGTCNQSRLLWKSSEDILMTSRSSKKLNFF